MKLKKNIAISESGFVFDPNTGDSFSMNPLGMDILLMIKEGKGKDAIFEYVLNTFEIDLDTFENNYYDFIGMLKQFHLLETISSDGKE